MADLMGSAGIYCCFKCRNQIACHGDIISKEFRGSHGRAFLFSHAMNIKEGAQEDRQLLSGLHRVSDVYCSDCGEELGWTYTKAFDETQKYKEGKFVLENFKIIVQSHFHPTDQL
ncbi:protein yippee-like At4g27745 [Neltuma alba]|uniref:protein yippee-like At4g27745 n=1 Tax=Neltuma alba TaxID=207710 RepID=UPI0010A407B0|nr:protein yippee-like At4g27745 [Prosopis alba]